MLSKLLFLPALVVAACVAPRPPASAPAPDRGALEADLAALRAEVDILRNKVGHLEAEIVASDAEHEFKSMTIDWVVWSDDPKAGPFWKPSDSTSPVLLCHVAEWDGFGRILRFTRKADPYFLLEAAGHPTVPAHGGEGGITSSDGAVRYIVLNVPILAPGVEYRIRPQNKKTPDYTWVVADAVRVPSR